MARIDGGWGFTYWQEDRLIGTAEADQIRANGGDDFVDGGSGSDQIWLGEGADIAFGGTGRDTIYGEDGSDEIHGEENSDEIYGGNGADMLFGEADHDLISAGAGNDFASGGSGRDTISGGIGADTLSGGTGNDVIADYEGNNRIDGGTDADGADIDTLDYSGLFGRVTVNLSTGTANAEEKISVVNGPDYFIDLGTSTVVNIEKVVGSLGNDELTGSSGNDLLFGGAGMDTISGGRGNDVISGGYGSDALSGGEGQDVFRFDTLGFSATNPTQSRDIIRDFNPADDTIQLDNAAFKALGAAGALDLDAFRSTTTLTPLAADAEDRLLYSTTTGDLYYDPDGTGAADASWIARFENRPILTAADFQII